MRVFVVLVLFLAAAVPATLNYSGMCIPQWRYLNEKELYEFAVRDGVISIFYEELYQGGKIQQPELTGDEYREFISLNVSKFVATKPECCRIIKTWKEWKAEGWFLPSFWGRITGGQLATVEVNYIGRKQNSTSYKNEAPRHIYRTIGNCGNVYKYF